MTIISQTQRALLAWLDTHRTPKGNPAVADLRTSKEPFARMPTLKALIRRGLAEPSRAQGHSALWRGSITQEGRKYLATLKAGGIR